MKNVFLRHNRWIVTIILCAGMTMHASAQTFTERVQKKVDGQGTVTIHQSEDIDELVNDPNATETQPSNKKPTGSSKNNSDARAKNQAGQQTNAGSEEENTTQPRTSYKITGYRVQAFAGGNTRKDRQMAEQACSNIKAHYPNVPVYVHFYSPRWICRVGNYRSYEEAHQMMVNLQNLGYKQASIVKGKIISAY